MAKRIIIAGAIEAHALYGGGNTWAFLQYVLGFRRLGCETYYIEELRRESCIDEHWRPTSFANSVNVHHFCALMKRFDLSGYAALLESEGSGYIGLAHREVEKLAREADVLLNFSGRLSLPGILDAARRLVYVDLDPGYTQIWQEQYGHDMNFGGHDVYLTVGLNLGAPDCPLPTCGIAWEKTLPPVVMEEWPATEAPGEAYTTVADWRAFGPVEWRGVWYGQKADQFKRIIDLPGRVSVPLELCLFIHPDEPDRSDLLSRGWRLVAPEHHAVTADSYRDYVRHSRGEFSVVKHGYAAARTGWFSDRSSCYLAAGRPVIVQDTGIGVHVPTGAGFLTFTDADSAAGAINTVESHYRRHSVAARCFAREFLDSDVVLPRLLGLAGV